MSHVVSLGFFSSNGNVDVNPDNSMIIHFINVNNIQFDFLYQYNLTNHYQLIHTTMDHVFLNPKLFTILRPPGKAGFEIRYECEKDEAVKLRLMI